MRLFMMLFVMVPFVVVFASSAFSQTCESAFQSEPTAKRSKWLAEEYLSAKFLAVAKKSKSGRYFRGVQIKSLEELDLAYNYREESYFGEDRVSPDLTDAINDSFHIGEGTVSVIIEYSIPEIAVRSDGRRSSAVVDINKLGLTQLSPLVSRVGVYRDTEIASEPIEWLPRAEVKKLIDQAIEIENG